MTAMNSLAFESPIAHGQSVHVNGVRRTTIDDLDGVLALYTEVAAIPGGLARLQHEIDRAYVLGFLEKALSNGRSYVAVDETARIVGEIHAYSPELFCFSHVLSDLTIAVAPDAQRCGVGRSLFESFLDDVRTTHRRITRVELIARESNRHAIELYESLGFVIEGRMEGRIRNVDGSVEADIPMAWSRAKS